LKVVQVFGKQGVRFDFDLSTKLKIML